MIELTKEEFYEKYGDIPVEFAKYARGDFLYDGTAQIEPFVGVHLITKGCNVDEVYAGELINISEINGVYGRAFNGKGEIVEFFEEI